MTASPALRLYDTVANRHVIVHDGRVYADRNRDRRIARDEAAGEDLLRDRHAALVEAAAYFVRYFDIHAPGAVNQDGSVACGGALDAVERAEFESAAGTPEHRTRLAEHVAFFDRRHRGRISPGDGYRGWRALRFGVVGALVQAAASALVFGWRHGGTIVIADLGRSRPSSPTGIYDRDGQIDQARWAQFRKAFERAAVDGRLSERQARSVIAAEVTLGRIPRRQFESLYRVCWTMNGGKTITIDQIRWLYDGSLLYRAASHADETGRRRLRAV